jgi:diguanylate cyclase
MADKLNGQDAELVWKDKYLNTLELIEQAEETSRLYAEQLKRCMVRVSLAADGIDPELDSVMSLFRNSLKKELSIQELEALGQKVEHSVLVLDQKKAQHQQQLRMQFDLLVKQLLVLEPPQKIKRELKYFQKKLLATLDNAYLQAGVVGAFAEVQAKTLQAVIVDHKEPKKSGFLRSLFGLSVPDKKEHSDILPVVVKANQTKDDYQLDDMPIPESLEFGSGSYASTHHDHEINFADSEAIRERMSGIFLTMLDLIYIPPASKAQEGQIRQKIGRGLRWHEVPDTLSILVSVVAESTNHIQRDTETFLHNLNTRLSDIQDFLAQNQHRTMQKESNSQQLGEAVKNHIADINNRLNNYADIGDLKGSIEQHLNHIMGEIDSYKQQEQKIDGDTLESVKTLTLRIESLEKEASVIRTSYMEHKEKAYTDTLTQLPNRLAYEKRSLQEYARWHRYGNPLALAVCDLDFFKKINDTYGHAAGDKVLSKVGEIFNKTLRGTDFSCRFGGEEFLILLPETNTEDSKLAMEKLRLKIEESPFHFRGERVQVTVSIGLSEFVKGDTLDQVFERADQAVYEAKNAGRNRIVIKT